MLDAEFNSESNGTVFRGGYRAKNRILLETEMVASESHFVEDSDSTRTREFGDIDSTV